MDNRKIKPELKDPKTKNKYIALHFGQMVAKCNTGRSDVCEVTYHSLGFGNPERFHLLLTPLDQITDDQVLHLAYLLGFTDGDYQIKRDDVVSIEVISDHDEQQWFTLYFVDGDIYFNDLNTDTATEGYRFLDAYDYLRSEGFAVRWNGHSVQQLIEAGYMKLREGGADNG